MGVQQHFDHRNPFVTNVVTHVNVSQTFFHSAHIQIFPSHVHF